MSCWRSPRAASGKLRPLIDFVFHVTIPTIPLDISLCRRLLREYSHLSSDLDPLDFVREYLSRRLGEVYRRQQQVAEHADLVVDGLRPPEELAARIIERVRLGKVGR